MFIEQIEQDIIKKQALDEFPNECCGLLAIDKNHQLNIIPCKNSSPRPQQHFLISGPDYLRAAEIGRIVAIFHSHLDGSEFSELDKINAAGNSLISIIYDVKNDKFSEFHPKYYNSPYINKIFKIGENDCFALIRDYYKNELNIEISDYFRDEKWSINEPDLYFKNYEKEGFYKVTDGPINEQNITSLKLNDVLLFRYGKNQQIDHAGVYVGAGMFLHHPRDRYSLIEPYDKPYQDRTDFVIRHKSFITKPEEIYNGTIPQV